MKTIISIFLALFFFQDLRSQHLFSEKIENCKPSSFMLEGESIMTKYDEEKLFGDIVYNIESDVLEKAKGEIYIQVIVDSIGNVCCLSDENNMNISTKDLGIIDIINTKTSWLAPIHDGKRIGASICLKLKFDNMDVTLYRMGIVDHNFVELSSYGAKLHKNDIETVIGTPTSLIKVFNFPDNYFYIQINGLSKNETERENVYIIDNKMVQVLCLPTDKFIKKEVQALSSIDILKQYIEWEKKYIESSFSCKIKSSTEFLKTKNNADFVFWTYEKPENQKTVRTDSTVIAPVIKHMFTIMHIKNYIIGTYTPLTEENKYMEYKKFLIANMEGILESKIKIDIEELNTQFNK